MNYGLVNKPKAPGATRRVWEIADEITARTGRLALRRDVIAAYEAEGGNRNTASTQYHYWKVAQEAEDEAADARDCETVRLRVGADGRVSLPPEMLHAMRVDPKGGVLNVRVENSELRAITPEEAARRAHAVLAGLKDPGKSVVDAFLAERRAMWGEE